MESFFDNEIFRNMFFTEHFRRILMSVIWRYSKLIIKPPGRTAWKVSKYGVIFGRTENEDLRSRSLYSVQIREKHGPGITPYFDTFHAVATWMNEIDVLLMLYLTKFQANIYLFKITNKNRKICELCSKLTNKIPEPEHIIQLFYTFYTIF